MIPSIVYRSLSRSWSFGVGASQSGTVCILAAGKAVWLPRHQLVYYAFIVVLWFFDHLLQFDGWDVPLSVAFLLDLCSIVPYVPVLIMEGSGLLAVVSNDCFYLMIYGFDEFKRNMNRSELCFWGRYDEEKGKKQDEHLLHTNPINAFKFCGFHLTFV